jgi:group I intron endonuclease
MYIYKIVNKLNGKVYIGQCIGSVESTLDYYGSGKVIKSAITKYGKDAFEKIILEMCNTREELNQKEIEYIEKYDTIASGYNISIGGNGGNLGEIVNKKISESVKRLWESGHYDSVDWSNKPPISEKTRRLLSMSSSGRLGPWKDRKFTAEHCENISIGTRSAFMEEEVKNNFLRAIRSDGHRKKLSEALRGKTPWNKGKSSVYSEDVLKKMSNSAKNRKIDPETEKTRREKISKHFSENHPNVKKILDTRTDILYNSLVEFCKSTDTSWYRTKKMRADGILKEI